MSNPESDDDLLEELRAVMRTADAVPAEVTEFAKAALGWRRLDAELAELLSDSLLEAGAGATRAGGSGARSLTFRSGELTIDVEIQTDGTKHLFLAQLAPAPATATVEVQRVDGEVAATGEADELGRIRLSVDGSGSVRLRVAVVGAAPIETSWFSL
jgi:hypothetical protein